MDLVFHTQPYAAYLERSELIDPDHPAVAALIERVRGAANGDVERARVAFELCRDEVRHSFDLEGPQPVSCSASDAAARQQGICFSKAHLLAAILRGLEIPAGFCYQRCHQSDGGFALHGFNAVYLAAVDRWIRLDPRGDKPGVHTRFSLEEEHLAYPTRPELGEIDYPDVLARPAPSVIAALRGAADTQILATALPSELAERAPTTP